MIKKAQQLFYHLRWLKKLSLELAAWYRNSYAHNSKGSLEAVQTAQAINGSELPSIQKRCIQQAVCWEAQAPLYLIYYYILHYQSNTDAAMCTLNLLS